MSTQVVEVSDGSIVVTTDVGLNGATKQSVVDEATARANADIALTAALALKAPLASPALTGTPTAPTAATANNTTQLATTAFVQQELAAGGSTSRSLVVSVRNQSGGTMTAGTVVYINGSTGNLPTIAKAIATSDATSAQTLGLVQTSIANNGTGLVVVRGILGNLNTSGLTEGQQLYLSPTTAGTYTTTKQYAPNHLVYIGIVTRAHPTQGSIEVAVQNGFEMDELHDVSAQSPTNGDTLRWNSATSLWEKSALGTLATQSGTFSGTSSGTNTGDNVAATESVSGIVELATLAEVATGTDTARAVTPAGVRSAFLSRFFDGYPNSDGATPNRAAGIYGPFDAVNNPREWIAGAASLTDFIQWTVPTVNPSADILLVSRGASSTGNYPWATSNAMAVWMDPSGNLTIAANGATWATNNRQFIYSGFRAAYSGRNSLISFYLNTGTSNPVVKFNGVDISSSFSVSNGASPVNWLDSAMVPTYRHVGYLWPAGPAPIVTPILGQTSAADDAFYMQTGKWPAWVVAGGSMGNPLLNSGFETAGGGGADVFADWTETVSGTSTINRDTSDFYAGTASCRLDMDSSASNATISSSTAGLLPNARFLIQFAAKCSVNGGSISIRTASAVLTSTALTTSWALYSLEFNTGATVGTLDILRASGVEVSRSMWIDSVRVTKLGALSLPSYQPINVLDDVSDIGGNQGRLLGCTPVTDKTNWRINANTWTNGNQQILAGSILDSTKDVIDLVEQSTTGTPTTTIGSASAGAQYKASSALTAGINPVTLVTRKLASNNVWVNSNSTAVVRTTIVGHRTN